MPRPQPSDTARRLDEIRVILQLIKTMKSEPDRNDIIVDLRDAVKLLCHATDPTHGQAARLVRFIMTLISRLEADPGSWDDEIEMLYDTILFLAGPSKPQLELVMPIVTDLKGNVVMASYPLPLDKVATFPITEMNAAGGFDPVDPADVFTVTSGDPVNLDVSIGTDANGAPAVVAKWLHTTDPLLTNVGFTLSDSAGNKDDVAQTLDMVAAAVVPDELGVDTTNVTLVDQPVPV